MELCSKRPNKCWIRLIKKIHVRVFIHYGENSELYENATIFQKEKTRNEQKNKNGLILSNNNINSYIFELQPPNDKKKKIF